MKWPWRRRPARPEVGQLVRVRKGAELILLEVEYVDDLMVEGLVPYPSTYKPGGAFEGGYRGRRRAWVDQIVEVVR